MQLIVHNPIGWKRCINKSLKNETDSMTLVLVVSTGNDDVLRYDTVSSGLLTFIVE